jgi:hypothetical protein
VDESKAFQAFKAQAIGEVRESDYLTAFRRLVDEIYNEIPARGGPQRRTTRAYRNACESAADLLLEWYQSAGEREPDRSSGFIVAHRFGYTWASFLYWDHKGI